ncbi:proline--tRNA ligase [archaeon]|jgi:prolyl-tRNA synthetase|nr:proline--tRNA ligase [archaeon]
MVKQEGITVKKDENFSEWYTQTIIKSEMADYTAVSGSIVYRPKSYAIWETIQREVDKKLKKLGVQNAYFPLFIPEKYLMKEANHIEGFSPEVAWVTHAGNSKLDERLAIRPTSETIMYPSYAKWIRSWKDLPLKLNQWNNVVRWEFKHAVPFLRGREFLWNEGHTVFAKREEAEKEMKDIIKLWDSFCKDYLALPSLVGQKSEKEKFAGAEYTWSTEFMMPNGKAIQGPDTHFDGQNFAKAFDISFLDENEKKQLPYQNTWAISTRMMGVMFAIHGDDKGLVLPPKIAPNKVVLIPILFTKTKDKVMKVAKDIEKNLKKYDGILDDREDYSAGWKFNEWELKGIPIRVELGPKDVENKQAVIVRRDSGEKIVVKLKDITSSIDKILEDIQTSLFEKAKKALYNSIEEVETISELKKTISKKKIGKANWCGKIACEENIKAKTSTKSLNSEFNSKGKGKCFACEAKSEYVTYFGKSY